MRHSLSLVILLAAVPAVAAENPPAPVPESVALKKTCDKGNFEDCYKLAGMHRRGEGAQKDAGKAAGLLKKACEGGHAQSCLDLGEMHRAAEGTAKDIDKTVLFWQKACDGTSGEACTRIGL